MLLRTLEQASDSDLEFEVACPHEGPLTRELGKLGIKFHLGHPSERLLGIKRKSLGKKGASILLYPVDFLISVLKLFILIRKRGYDLVLTNSAKADIYGSAAARLAGKPVVWRIHDIVDRDAFNSLNLFLFGFFGKFFASKVLAISNAVSRAIISIGVPEEKVLTIYNGVNVQAEIDAEKRRKIRDEFGLDEGTPVAVMVGRLVDWKGPDVFIRACSAVAQQVQQAKFLLVGSPLYGDKEYVNFLKKLSSELKMDEKIIFTGFREDAFDVISSADCLVHASTLPEPFGLVIVEAMSLGVPVIATNAGGVPEIVEDGVTGILVPPGDANSLASAMVRLLVDPDLRKEMGERAKTRAFELFDIRNNSREIFDALESVAKKGKG